MHILVQFMEKKPSTKFHCIWIIFQEVMMLPRVEGLDVYVVSDVIPVNVHNMCSSAVHNVFGTKAYLVWEFAGFFRSFFCFCVIYVGNCSL